VSGVISGPAQARFIALCASALFLSVAVGQAQQANSNSVKTTKEQVSADSELGKAPERARARPNPLEHDPDAVAAGKKLFGRHCSECHGAAAEGSHRAPSLRDSEVQEAPPGAIFWLVTNGIVWHGMPVWSKLPEPQRWQLVTYIKSLGQKPQASAAH
jgi:mono/diheme cytochrome c family protein